MYARGTVMGAQLGTDGAEYGVGRGPAVGGFAGESSAYVGEDIGEERRGWMPKNAPRGAVMTDAGSGAFRMTTVRTSRQSVSADPPFARIERERDGEPCRRWARDRLWFCSLCTHRRWRRRRRLRRGWRGT